MEEASEDTLRGRGDATSLDWMHLVSSCEVVAGGLPGRWTGRLHCLGKAWRAGWGRGPWQQPGLLPVSDSPLCASHQLSPGLESDAAREPQSGATHAVGRWRRGLFLLDAAEGKGQHPRSERLREGTADIPRQQWGPAESHLHQGRGHRRTRELQETCHRGCVRPSPQVQETVSRPGRLWGRPLEFGRKRLLSWRGRLVSSPEDGRVGTGPKP